MRPNALDRSRPARTSLSASERDDRRAVKLLKDVAQQARISVGQLAALANAFSIPNEDTWLANGFSQGAVRSLSTLFANAARSLAPNKREAETQLKAQRQSKEARDPSALLRQADLRGKAPALSKLFGLDHEEFWLTTLEQGECRTLVDLFAALA